MTEKNLVSSFIIKQINNLPIFSNNLQRSPVPSLPIYPTKNAIPQDHPYAPFRNAHQRGSFPQDADTAIEASFTGIHTEQCADGKGYTFSIYGDGNLEGTIVVVNDPAAPNLTIDTFDAGGAQLEGTTLDAADPSGLALDCDTTCQIQGFIEEYGLDAIVWPHLPDQPFWEGGLANVGLVLHCLP